MNQNKEKGEVTLNESPRKLCSKSKEHASRNISAVSEHKHGVHSGLKFSFKPNKKITVVKPFSFDSGPKIEKGSLCSSFEKTAGKQTTREQKQKVAGSHVNVTTECIKISKEFHSETRSVSNEISSKSLTNEDTRGKKPCSRCSRAASPQIQPSKTVNSPTSISKAFKSQAQSSKATTVEEKPLKAKKSQAQPSNIAKPQVHFSNVDKSAIKVSNAKGCDSSCVEKSNCEISKDTKQESKTSDIKKPPLEATSNAEATESKLPNGLETKPGCKHLNEEIPESQPLTGLGTNLESDSSTGTDSEPSDGINHEGDQSNAIKISETGTQKSASKIPRKKCGPNSGLKFHENFKKETIPQPFSFENRCSNLKKENINREANHVQITNLVNN